MLKNDDLNKGERITVILQLRDKSFCSRQDIFRVVISSPREIHLQEKQDLF